MRLNPQCKVTVLLYINFKREFYIQRQKSCELKYQCIQPIQALRTSIETGNLPTNIEHGVEDKLVKGRRKEQGLPGESRLGLQDRKRVPEWLAELHGRGGWIASKANNKIPGILEL